MNVLAHHDLHNLDDERWNAYGQFTYISSFKLAFSAPYTNANGSDNSLLPGYERSFTGSFTLFFALKLWRGGEVYFVPEAISENPLSGLHGLGGAIQNFELQKQGSEVPQVYRARTYFRQTFNLGGEPAVLTPCKLHAARHHQGEEPPLGLYARQLQHPGHFRQKLGIGRRAQELFQYGVHDPRVVGFSVGRARLLLGRGRRILLGQLGGAHRAHHAAAASQSIGHRFSVLEILRRPAGAGARSHHQRIARRGAYIGVSQPRSIPGGSTTRLRSSKATTPRTPPPAARARTTDRKTPTRRICAGVQSAGNVKLGNWSPDLGVIRRPGNWACSCAGCIRTAHRGRWPSILRIALCRWACARRACCGGAASMRQAPDLA